MTTISARIDNVLKEEAEAVADEIGISLSAAICVFLKKFVAEEGFPFEVKAKAAKLPRELSTGEITRAVQESVLNRQPVPMLPPVTYLDPITNQPRTV